MQEQAQAQDSPDQSQPDLQDSPQFKELASDREVATREMAQKQAVADAKRQAIVDKARAAMRAEFRQSQGLPAPEPTRTFDTAAPPTSPADQLASATTTQATQAPSNTGALAEAITSGLQDQFRQAEAMRAEAGAMAAEANRKAAEAEAKLQDFVRNPTAYLDAQGLDMDAWQARLLNGGEPTEAERLKAELKQQIDPALAAMKAELQQLKAESYQTQRTKVVQELTPILAKDFPIVNRLMGPDAVLKELERLRDETKQRVDPQQVLANLENRFLQQYQESLQDQAVANKLGLSVKSPLAGVAAQSPQTLSNRVTSTVPSASSRATTEQERKARGREQIRKLLAAGQL